MVKVTFQESVSSIRDQLEVIEEEATDDLDLRKRLAQITIESDDIGGSFESLDPFSKDYSEAVLQMFQELTSKTYDINREGLDQVDIRHRIRWSHPYGSPPSLAGDYIMSYGYLVKKLDLPLNSRVLEVGCGEGGLSYHLVRMGYQLTAIDINQSAVETTKGMVSGLQTDGIETAVLQIDFQDLPAKTYDAIIFYESFHHFCDHQATLDKAISLLAPNGRIVFGAEPILEKEDSKLPYPWGLRLDGESLRAILKFGWMELGFTEGYFFELMRRYNLSCQRFRNLENGWSSVIVAQLNLDQPVGLNYDEVYDHILPIEKGGDRPMYARLKDLVISKIFSSWPNTSERINLQRMPLQQYIDLAYRLILRRAPDEPGLVHFERLIEEKNLDRTGLLDQLVASDEYQALHPYNNLSLALHESRKRFIKGMPRAKRIVDLGGSAQGANEGALVLMGYPYQFDKLTIVDLPISDRHQIYQNNDEAISLVETSLGTVEYQYGSMTDLSMLEDSSIDLVYSGQTIEHVTRQDAEKVYQEVLRVLKPGALFFLDTPNREITRLQQSDYVDPDHKIEYTHAQLTSDLRQAGFNLLEEKGLNYAGISFAKKQFDVTEIMRNVGIYGEPQSCYLLAYVCAKPMTD